MEQVDEDCAVSLTKGHLHSDPSEMEESNSLGCHGISNDGLQ